MQTHTKGPKSGLLGCCVCGAAEDPARGYDDGRGYYWCEACGRTQRAVLGGPVVAQSQNVRRRGPAVSGDGAVQSGEGEGFPAGRACPCCNAEAADDSDCFCPEWCVESCGAPGDRKAPAAGEVPAEEGPSPASAQRCEPCGGTGRVPGSLVERACRTCDGAGHVEPEGEVPAAAAPAFDWKSRKRFMETASQVAGVITAALGLPGADESAAIRRCEAPGADGELCGAGLGRDLQCSVCNGARCFGHCGGVDHRGGVLISQGGAGRVEWRLRALATREFAGQITVDAPGGKAVAKSFLGRDPEEVKNRMLAHVDELIGAQDAIAYATPAVRPLPAGHEKVAALLALVRLGQSAQVREQDLLHTLERRRRAAVDAAADWYERATKAWEREAADPETNPRMVERCRALFEAQVTELFMRLGAAL